MDTLGRWRKNVPSLFLFYKREKIILSVDLKLQFAYLTSPKAKNSSHGFSRIFTDLNFDP